MFPSKSGPIPHVSPREKHPATHRPWSLDLGSKPYPKGTPTSPPPPLHPSIRSPHSKKHPAIHGLGLLDPGSKDAPPPLPPSGPDRIGSKVRAAKMKVQSTSSQKLPQQRCEQLPPSLRAAPSRFRRSSATRNSNPAVLRKKKPGAGEKKGEAQKGVCLLKAGVSLKVGAVRT